MALVRVDNSKKRLFLVLVSTLNGSDKKEVTKVLCATGDFVQRAPTTLNRMKSGFMLRIVLVGSYK